MFQESLRGLPPDKHKSTCQTKKYIQNTEVPPKQKRLFIGRAHHNQVMFTHCSDVHARQWVVVADHLQSVALSQFHLVRQIVRLLEVEVVRVVLSEMRQLDRIPGEKRNFAFVLRQRPINTLKREVLHGMGLFDRPDMLQSQLLPEQMRVQHDGESLYAFSICGSKSLKHKTSSCSLRVTWRKCTESDLRVDHTTWTIHIQQPAMSLFRPRNSSLRQVSCWRHQVARFVKRTRFTAFLPLDVFRLKFTQIQWLCVVANRTWEEIGKKDVTKKLCIQ